MQTKMVVMFFETIDRAERAFNALDALERAGEGFAIDSAGYRRMKRVNRLSCERRPSRYEGRSSVRRQAPCLARWADQWAQHWGSR